jgi:hypothetical protein
VRKVETAAVVRVVGKVAGDRGQEQRIRPDGLNQLVGPQTVSDCTAVDGDLASSCRMTPTPLNAEEEPENEDYPKNPEFQKNTGRVVSSIPGRWPTARRRSRIPGR